MIAATLQRNCFLHRFSDLARHTVMFPQLLCLQKDVFMVRLDSQASREFRGWEGDKATASLSGLRVYN